MRTHGTTFASPARTTGPARLVAPMLRVLEVVDGWLARRRQRLDLGQLDDRMLKDLGLSRADVAREAGKPFWRP